MRLMLLQDKGAAKAFRRIRPLTILSMKEVYYVYILVCNDGTRYYGQTNNLGKRFSEHTKGKVLSTKDKRPLRLAYYEELNSRSEAFRRERQFKNGKTRKKTIEELSSSFCKTKLSRVQFADALGKRAS